MTDLGQTVAGHETANTDALPTTSKHGGGACQPTLTVKTVIPHPTKQLIENSEVEEYDDTLKLWDLFSLLRRMVNTHIYADGCRNSLNIQTQMRIYTLSANSSQPQPGDRTEQSMIAVKYYVIPRQEILLPSGQWDASLRCGSWGKGSRKAKLLSLFCPYHRLWRNRAGNYWPNSPTLSWVSGWWVQSQNILMHT